MSRRKGMGHHCLRRVLIFIICGLLTLAAPAEAATRLGLHVTQEELNVWKQRMSDTINGANGQTYQQMYQSRILADANSFRSNPTDGLWNPSYSGCFPEGLYPGRQNGRRMMAAAFVYLLTGDTSYANAVAVNLRTQIARASTTFADASRFCKTFSDQQMVEIPGWVTRLLFAYDYVRAGDVQRGSAPILSNSDRVSIEMWFNNAAIYGLKRLDATVKSNAFPGRPTNYACTGWACPASNIGPTHWQGFTVYSFHNTWSNRSANVAQLVGVVANMHQPLIAIDSNLAPHLKWWFDEAIQYSIFPDGTDHELYRWRDCAEGAACSIGSAWGHASLHWGPLITIADAFGRNGDVSLYQFTSSGGLYGTGGTAKSLLSVMKDFAGMANGTIQKYATATGNTNSSTLHRWNVEGGHAEDWASMLGNLYYRDTTVRAAMQMSRTPTSSCGAFGCYGGPWGIFPDMPFMWSKLDSGQVNPYRGTTRGDVDRDGAVDLDDVRALIAMLIGQALPNLTTADLDGDGQLGLGDVRALITILVTP